MIPFNITPALEGSFEYMRQAAQEQRKISGDGVFTRQCGQWLERRTGAAKALLTTSCTHALELAAMLCGIQPGDEVIMPSYTFVSTADAFVRLGARIVFVDIRPDTMNIDENLIEQAITAKTKAIASVHYAGVSCEMDTIMDLAHRYGLKVVEDAAQGIMCTYKGRPLGAIGDFGCFSFHETKNYSMGEGGAILVNDAQYITKAEIIREKGTNRSQFFRGMVDKYTWVDYGSSYLPSELNAAYLWAQLEQAEKINDARLAAWRRYYEQLKCLQDRIDLPVVPEECVHNAHMFYIKARDLEERTELIQYLKSNEIGAPFHYVPLHSSPAGMKYGRFAGEDRYTTRESDRLLRLPMYYGITDQEIDTVVEAVKLFYKGRQK